MKVSLVILLLISAFMIQPQATYVKEKKFEGFIFDDNHYVFKSIPDQKSRFTPSREDIKTVEDMLESDLLEINSPRLNQGRGCPVIHRKLDRYLRQYVGFINDKCEKVIWINFLWNKKVERERAANDIVVVLDGCSHYWNIKANISSKTLFDLKVNGPS